MNSIRRVGDTEKCPACGWSLDAGAYRCPKCLIYFCYKCRKRITIHEVQYQCANQACPCYGKLLCSACVVSEEFTIKKEEQPPSVFPPLRQKLKPIVRKTLIDRGVQQNFYSTQRVIIIPSIILFICTLFLFTLLWASVAVFIFFIALEFYTTRRGDYSWFGGRKILLHPRWDSVTEETPEHPVSMTSSQAPEPKLVKVSRLVCIQCHQPVEHLNN